MDLQNRISILVELGEFMLSEDISWKEAKTKAFQHNAWFIPDFIDLSISQIAERFLQRDLLEKWASEYEIPEQEKTPEKSASSWPATYHLWVSMIFFAVL
jgi:hypothetical protein